MIMRSSQYGLAHHSEPPLYPLNNTCITIFTPIYTFYTCIYTIYIPYIHTANTPLNTLYAPSTYALYTPHYLNMVLYRVNLLNAGRYLS